MRRCREHGPYNKIVGPFRPCGLRLRQVMHRPTDPPEGIECAGGADGQTAIAELDSGRGNRERNVETIVHEQASRPPRALRRAHRCLETGEAVRSLWD